MKILIVGGVAAGTKAAAKLKRENRDADVTILTKSQDISYAGCGLPYFVGGLIPTREELIVNTPAKYMGLTGAKVQTGIEVTRVDAAGKKVTGKNLQTGESTEYTYDKLIIASGASPIVPGFEGKDLPGVYTMRTPDDATGLRSFIEEKQCKRAVVVGGGFIGLEIAENLKEQGLQVTVVDLAKQIMPNVFDEEMALYVKKHLNKQGVKVMTGVSVEGILGTDAVEGIQTDAGKIVADVVVLSIGIRPNTAFLSDTGIDMVKGCIQVNEKMETSVADIYAAGDCTMVTNRITGKGQWSAMGSTANYAGRMLAQILNGKEKAYPGCLGTGVVKLPGLNGGRTGLTEVQAKENGFDVVTVTCVVDDKAHYYPGAGSFITKLIADKTSHKLLGLQVLGSGAVDKMTDIAVTGISMGAVLEDFDGMDFSYAPPFSTAIHPFVQACYILLNKIDGSLESFTPAEYLEGKAKGYRVIDVQPQAKIAGATWVNLSKVEGPIEGLGLDEKLLLVCTKGKRGYFLQNRMKHFGYTNTRVLEGGVFVNDVKVEGVKTSIPPEEVKRVKGLGCLWDKNTPDKFNIRVITINGKITTDQQIAVAEAAEKFGSGEVTMTTRLTLEIQGVPFDKIDDCIDFLAQHGLATGGTGSKVRPVVSCKGTTCQYGLIDTFDLSKKTHELFYEGYRKYNLPHKFKIAVGGCPNNCVKPNLNDIGVIGQRVPQFNLDKCKGCKVCQVENACPIKVASVENGKLKVDPDACNHCGRCASKCPFGCTDEYVNGYKVYIGGRWGKKVAQGRELEKIFTTEQEVLDVVEKAILLFREEGIAGERFADTVNRIGFEVAQEKLLGDELLASKSNILNTKGGLAGGATC